MPFRLWQTQLQQKYPIWAAADVAPKNGGSWKGLVATATKIEAPAALDMSLDLHQRFECPVAECKKLWNSGDDLSLHARSDCAEEHTDVVFCVLIKPSGTSLLVGAL